MIDLRCGDCLAVLRRLPAESVHCCVTSPPYFGLRDYGVDGQIGLERSPDAYVAKLVEVFREVRRVLRDDGTLWLNLGDSYASGGGGWAPQKAEHLGYQVNTRRAPSVPGLAQKQLLGIPWRVAFALQADGWYLRSDIIWHKPNPMPESVRDRPTKAHEYLFLLAKSERYYYDAEAIAEASIDPESHRGRNQRFGDQFWKSDPDGKARTRNGFVKLTGRVYPTRNRRSVWTITPRPFREAHFATFPPALVEPCILAGTSERGCCERCGAPWGRVVNRKGDDREFQREQDPRQSNGASNRTINGTTVSYRPPKVSTLDWQPSCQCHAPAIPCVVLDPFSGAGTTGLVAAQHGRSYVGIELNREYVAMSRRRIKAALAAAEACA